jgi:hypothetical protein
MTEGRSRAVGVVTDDDRPWILGGMDSSVFHTSSEEWNQTADGEIFWTSGPDLEKRKSGHCAVSTFNGQRAIITGGETSYKTVEWFDLITDQHNYSIDLTHNRYAHGCAAFLTPLGTESIVLAGQFGLLR